MGGAHFGTIAPTQPLGPIIDEPLDFSSRLLIAQRAFQHFTHTIISEVSLTPRLALSLIDVVQTHGGYPGPGSSLVFTLERAN